MTPWFRPLALVTLLALAVPAAAQSLDDVAVAGGAAPIAGQVYETFHDPAVGDDADSAVVFQARIKGTKRRECLVRLGVDGSGEVLACEKGPAPDGGTFSQLIRPGINASGDVVWAGHVRSGPNGVYRNAGIVVAREGDDAPIGTFNQFTDVAITNAGDVVFRANLLGDPDVGHGIFRCAGGAQCTDGGTGTIEALVLQGDAVPDRGVFMCSIADFSASNHGIVLRGLARPDCGGEPQPGQVGVFRKTYGGPLVTVALQGEAANPAPFELTVYGTLGRPSIQDDGIVAFRSRFTNDFDIDGLALYVCDPAADCPEIELPATAVQAGDTDADGNVLGGLSDPVLNAAGDFAFVSSRGKACGAYVYRTDGTIETIAFASDLVLDDTARLLCPGPVAMSPGGKIAFAGPFKSLVTRKRSSGIFLYTE